MNTVKRKYIVTATVRFLVEAENKSDAVYKALDADLSRATNRKGVQLQGTRREHVATEAMDKLEHIAMREGRPPMEFHKI
jgi:hypothetical protein